VVEFTIKVTVFAFCRITFNYVIDNLYSKWCYVIWLVIVDIWWMYSDYSGH